MFDYDDWTAISSGIQETSQEADRWCHYEVTGSSQVEFSLARDPGSSIQKLIAELYERGLQRATKTQKTLKQRLVKLMDKVLLRKRSLIESVNDQLKNICQIEQSRHRSCWNFLVNLIAGLVAYTYQPKLPSLDLQPKGLPALPPTIF